MERRIPCRFLPLQISLVPTETDHGADRIDPLSTCEAQEMQSWGTAGDGTGLRSFLSRGNGDTVRRLNAEPQGSGRYPCLAPESGTWGAPFNHKASVGKDYPDPPALVRRQCWLQLARFERFVTVVNLCPVHHVPPRRKIFGPAIVVLQIVRVLPNVVAHDREQAL